MSADLFAAFDEDSIKSRARNETIPNHPAPLSFGTIPSTASSNAVHPHSKSNSQWLERSSYATQPGPAGAQRQGSHLVSSLGPWAATTSNPTAHRTDPPKGDGDNEDGDEDEDGWGDFEVAPSANHPSLTLAADSHISKQIRTQPAVLQSPPPPRPSVARVDTIDLMSNNLLGLDDSTAFPEKPKSASKTHRSSGEPSGLSVGAVRRSVPKKNTNSDPNVLFDADDFSGEQLDVNEDDDFGDFETVASPAQPAPDLIPDDLFSYKAPERRSASDLLSGLTLNPPTSTIPQAQRSPSHQHRNPFPGLALTTSLETRKQASEDPKSTPVTAWPSANRGTSATENGVGDDWGAFDVLPDELEPSSARPTESNWDWDAVEPAAVEPAKATSPVAQAPEKDHPSNEDSTWDWDPVAATTDEATSSRDDKPPPTNIPPPSVLLSVFPQLFDQVNTALYKPISGQAFSIKNRVLSDPKTVEFLKGYLNLATVAARIIAGRKQRWHRDKFLTQGMSISAAGSKGMKLAGVDRAQTAREDREATDVLTIWRDHVGRLRSAVAAANSSIRAKPEQLKIPEMNDTMQIQTAKGVPTAPKACIICGLKRNERVVKVDHEVEDSFGEWWIDHWGHLACKRFWLQHENTLRQR